MELVSSLSYDAVSTKLSVESQLYCNLQAELC